MASKRHQRRNACTGKVRYESKDAAQAHIASLWFRHGQSTHAYRCQFCSGWHVGHAQKRRAPRREGATV